jgi:glutamate 5-kinase
VSVHPLQFGTSSLLSDDGCKPKLSNIAKLVEVAVRLRETGHNVVIVSSGAVGTGCARMKLKSRPDSVAKKQAMASIGQLHLMRIYDEFFSTLGHTCSQVRACVHGAQLPALGDAAKSCMCRAP